MCRQMYLLFMINMGLFKNSKEIHENEFKSVCLRSERDRFSPEKDSQN